MSKEQKQLLICNGHTDYLVPLIMTFKFRGQEYWCPYCGNTFGFFGNYVEVVSDKELEERLKKFKALSKEFLSNDNVKYQYNQKL